MAWNRTAPPAISLMSRLPSYDSLYLSLKMLQIFSMAVFIISADRTSGMRIRRMIVSVKDGLIKIIDKITPKVAAI